METKRRINGLVAMVMLAGAILAGAAAAATPNYYYDVLRNPSANNTGVVSGSSTTSTVTPDYYYDV